MSLNDIFKKDGRLNYYYVIPKLGSTKKDRRWSCHYFQLKCKKGFVCVQFFKSNIQVHFQKISEGQCQNINRVINPPIHPSLLAAINIKDLYYFYSIGYSIYSFLCFITFYHRFFDKFQIYWRHCYITLKVTIQNIVFYPNFCRTSLITIQIYLRQIG